jgi:hypothetical protein
MTKSSYPEIYYARSAEGYEFANPSTNEDQLGVISLAVSGGSRSERIPSVTIHREDEGRKLQPADAPYIGGWTIALTAAALDKAGPLLRDYGRIVKVSCTTPLYVFCCGTVLDALDEAKSQLTRSGGLVINIKRFAFNDKIGNTDVFRLASWRVSPLYFSRRFVDAWDATGIKGFKFVRAEPVE